MPDSFRDITFPKTYKYSSDSEFIPLQFYSDTFSISKEINILLGYFSSSAFKVLSHSLAEFLVNDGKMNIVTNHIMSFNDKKELFINNNIQDDNHIIDIFKDVELLEKELSDNGKHFFDCLKYLLKQNRLTLTPVKFNEIDLAHSKRMVLFDGKEYISTDGSINFTLPALTKNSESFEVNVPWEGKVFKERIKQEINNFDLILSKKHENYTYLNPSEIEGVINSVGRDKNIQDLLEDSISIIKNNYGKKVQKILRRKKTLFNEIAPLIHPRPSFPFEKPRKYQEEAYTQWKKNNMKGIFAMATGTGKTITSLNIILNEYHKHKYYRFIVLVPSIALADQWEKEISLKFNFRETIVCNSKNSEWENEVRTKAKNLEFSKQGDFSIISTYSTYKGEKFQKAFFGIIKNQINTVTLIADEAHTMGTPQMLNKLPKQITKRIGLSATPDRLYDEEGSLALSEYFDSHHPSYTYRYSMKRAIDNKVLCEYEYYPVFFDLTEEELIKYQEYTNQLRKFLDNKTGKYKQNEYSKKLLIRRKQVIHKASNKIKLLDEIVGEIGVSNFNYAFIYVPEGIEPNYQNQDHIESSTEDINLINTYNKHLYDNYKFKLKKYTGQTTNRDLILTNFAKGKYNALLAMKCLDEGVDVPRAQIAIFCSSTGNPRQFIQRRGRVLRTHEDKKRAIIYDLIATPTFQHIDSDSKQLSVEKNIFIGELNRVINFAALAFNLPELTKGKLNRLCEQLGINLHEKILNELNKYQDEQNTR